jgi:hypothetical protein
MSDSSCSTPASSKIPPKVEELAGEAFDALLCF